MSLFDQRIRGFRVVELGAVACLLVLVLAVYLNKAGAGRERANIDAVQAQIDEEQSKVRLLKAEVAHLEQPERIEMLSTQYLGLGATAAKHEIAPDSLVAVVEEAKKPVKKDVAAAKVINMTPFPTVGAAEPPSTASRSPSPNGGGFGAELAAADPLPLGEGDRAKRGGEGSPRAPALPKSVPQ